MVKKFTSTIAGGAIFITLIGLIGRGLGVIRESIFANYFGLSQKYDLYLVAIVFPVTINSIFIYFTQNFYIPKYHQLKIESEEKAKNFTNSVFWFFAGFGILTSVILIIFSDVIINAYVITKDINQINIAISIFRIFIFSIPFGFSSSILSAILQANYEFKFPPFSQLFLNVFIILTVVLFSNGIGIFSIAWGNLIGVIFQFAYLYLKTTKLITLEINHIKISYVKKIFDISFISILLIEILGQVYLLSDRYFLHSVESGGIAALNYSYNIYLLPISIISMALATAMLPRLSSLISEGAKVELTRNMNLFIEVTLFLFTPIAIIFFFDGDVIIKILFQRGKFLLNDTIITSNTLKLYTLSLIFFATYSGINRLLYSTKMIRQLLTVVILAAISKIFFNFILVEYFEQDGLALSTSISFLILFVGSYIILIYKKIIFISYFFIKNFALNIFNGFASYIIINLIFQSLFGEGVILRLIMINLFITMYIINANVTKQKSLQLFIGTAKAIPVFNFIQKEENRIG